MSMLELKNVGNGRVFTLSSSVSVSKKKLLFRDLEADETKKGYWNGVWANLCLVFFDKGILLWIVNA
jgi:hypothetical protein